VFLRLYLRLIINAIQDEIIRVIDAIQLGDKHRIATPVNWKQGEEVIIHASVNNEEAKTLFPNHTVHLVRRIMFL
jgi:20S proteasome subunit alpha 2